ncbi:MULTISPECIES: hypothetical protein [Arthrobacter]|uniref:Uncharacterized protein n=1 Tax=Arthrobacter terricola TaxID=2547396 RepID=A0A4R5KNL4_9MICC|nr:MULTISPECIES: hypothetical protein [Arthrobacter]MBT8160988.1 hypothetical protein [Arthrobacter sp. GN70]TDF96852.1 hypothetical protein E1809_09010 [Arthrobacter terricola]
MGFISKYTKTERIDLEDGFWVEIRPHLTAAQKAAAEDKLVSMDGNTSGMQIGTGAYNIVLTTQAICSWNLTDEHDNPMPVTPEDKRLESVKRLPSWVTAKVVAAIRDAETKSAEGRAAFPGGSGESPAVAGQQPEAPVAVGAVPEGGGVLDEVRGEAPAGGPQPLA